MKPIILENPCVGKIILPGIDEKKASEEIVDGIIRYMKDSLGDGIVIGLSGGVDSSLVAVLCKKAIDKMKGRFYALIMPSQESGTDDEKDATDLALKLGLERKPPDELLKSSSGFTVIQINELDKVFTDNFHVFKTKAKNTLPHENMLSRCRMILLYGFKESLPGTRVAGTGNLDEAALGYFTKYGDGGVDFSSIGGLSKRMVRSLAKYNGVAKHIVNKTPSAGLRKGQTDEDDLGCTYLQSEVIIRGKEYRERIVDICQTSDNLEIRKIDKAMINRVLYRHEKLSQHKLKSPPVIKVTFLDSLD